MNKRKATSESVNNQPQNYECLKNYFYSGSNMSGQQYDPDRSECKAFKKELQSIKLTGTNHGLSEGETLLLINWLYHRGYLWETIPFGEMGQVREFVSNNSNRIQEAIDISRGKNITEFANSNYSCNPRIGWQL